MALLPALAAAGACQAPARDAISGGFGGVDVARGHLLRQPPAEQPVWRAGDPLRRCHTVIVGGGVSGLAAARTLRLAGVDDLALLELEDQAGGNSRGGQLGGLSHPLGAHYLPVPSGDQRALLGLLEELGLCRWSAVAGRWVFDERHLCHSPQERLFLQGQWMEGLVPLEGAPVASLAAFRGFADAVATARAESPFRLAASDQPVPASHARLDAQPFLDWLHQKNLADPLLLAHLDYCCRDDYGAGLVRVSAWAGIHYFASRHGFVWPDAEAGARSEGVLTWPEGNGWLTRQMATPLGDRLRSGQVVLRVVPQRHQFLTEAWDVAHQRVERWVSRQVVMAVPLRLAARLLHSLPPALPELLAHQSIAPWVVSNLLLRQPLWSGSGAPPSWDNVLHRPWTPEGPPRTSLGYVDASHQLLRQGPGPTVLTHYQALGDLGSNGARHLLAQGWRHWRDRVLDDLAVAHPDLERHCSQIQITRYGHAMAIPVPGQRSHTARLALQQAPSATRARLVLAHADLAAYSVFEEAFAQGERAARQLLA